MKIVVDTNAFVAALFGGHAALVLTGWKADGLHLVMSPPVLAEYLSILGRHPLCPADKLAEWLTAWQDVSKTLWVNPAPGPGYCKDPSDDKFIDAALAGGAEALLTADKLLLSLKSVGGVEILPVRRFAERGGPWRLPESEL